ncbi:MAG: hypothetical protein COA86_18895 [Kangiella sp.]|nr:MAG: hypothetical protein COA86_18895 [Kangiella sp.]
MNIYLKILGSLILFILALGLAMYFYFFIEQKIEVQYIPKEFRYCEKTITNVDLEYNEIVSWLKKNKEGWSRDWNTPIAGKYYSHPAFSVVVFQGGISVSYKTDNGYPRFIKSANHEFSTSCSGDS